MITYSNILELIRPYLYSDTGGVKKAIVPYDMYLVLMFCGKFKLVYSKETDAYLEPISEKARNKLDNYIVYGEPTE